MADPADTTIPPADHDDLARLIGTIDPDELGRVQRIIAALDKLHRAGWSADRIDGFIDGVEVGLRARRTAA